jgi:excisionase family DNA binding protein
MNSIVRADSDGADASIASSRTAFSVQETADQLGVCPASVYRALKRGQLEAVTLGGRRLIPARSIQKLLSPNAA